MALRPVALQLGRRYPAELPLLRRAPIEADPGHIGGDKEGVGLDLGREHGTGQVFIDDGVHPPELAILADHRDPAPTAADDDEACFNQLLDLAVLDDRERRGARHHPPIALVGPDHRVGQAPGLLFAVERADRLGGVLKGRILLIHHDVGDQGDEELLVGDADLHQGPVQGRFDHVPDLPLGHGDDDFERHVGHLAAALLLEQKVSGLGAVAVGDHETVVPGEARNLAHGSLQVGELLLGRALLTFPDQGVAAKGDEQKRFVRRIHLSVFCSRCWFP